MLTTTVSAQDYSAAVSAALMWVKGDTGRLAELVTRLRRDAPSLIETIRRDAAAGDYPAVRRGAQCLHHLLAPFGLPRLCVAAALLEELADVYGHGMIVRLVEELRTAVEDLCAHLDEEPRFRS